MTSKTCGPRPRTRGGRCPKCSRPLPLWPPVPARPLTDIEAAWELGHRHALELGLPEDLVGRCPHCCDLEDPPPVLHGSGNKYP